MPRVPELVGVTLTFETIIGCPDDGLQRIGTSTIEVGILAEQLGHHRDRLSGSLRRRYEVDGIEP